MLLPDVTAIINDPDVGGGVPFQVIRSTIARRGPSDYENVEEVFNETGNIQPQDKSNQASTPEDKLEESIVIYTTFTLQDGSNNGVQSVEADVIFYNGIHWRITKVDDWSAWGYTRGYATRIRDEDRWKTAPASGT